MNITKHNCESFFLDYYEKNLSPVEVAEVLFFLEENPEMKEIFEAYEAVFLEHEKINFPDKNSLKKKYSSEELDTVLSSEITKANSEQFFVAAAEGILLETQNQKLNAFLSQHPELKKEFDLFQRCKVPAEQISFENKHLLKKETINAQNREEYFVRSVEKDLSIGEQKELIAFLQKNPEYKKEIELFGQTILAPEKISFEFKDTLKKREKKRKPVVIPLFSQRTTYYAAAAILLLAGLFFFLQPDENTATYVADKTVPSTEKAVSVKSITENKAEDEKEQSVIPVTKEKDKTNNNGQVLIRKNSSANKNSIVPESKSKEENVMSSPVPTEQKMEEPLIAKKAEEKKTEETQIENPAVAKNPEAKKDSAAATKDPVAQNEAIASVQVKAKEDEYQTVGVFVNKKLRGALGIKKTNECETSDKIDLWDLAMAAKKGVQKAIGAKKLDVNKICDDTGEKVEYVFAAGNFEISKGSAR